MPPVVSIVGKSKSGKTALMEALISELKSRGRRIAIATDEPLETKIRQFSLHDIKGLADLLENSFIKPK
jgi:uridine kinase